MYEYFSSVPSFFGSLYLPANCKRNTTVWLALGPLTPGKVNVNVNSMVLSPADCAGGMNVTIPVDLSIV